MLRTTSLALALILITSASANASGRPGYSNPFVAAYPLARGLGGNAYLNGGYGGHGYGQDSSSLTQPSDPGRLDRLSALSDEPGERLSLQNEALRASLARKTRSKRR